MEKPKLNLTIYDDAPAATAALYELLEVPLAQISGEVWQGDVTVRIEIRRDEPGRKHASVFRLRVGG